MLSGSRPIARARPYLILQVAIARAAIASC